MFKDTESGFSNDGNPSLFETEATDVGRDKEKSELTADLLEQIASMSSPAWPLQHTVAVNPFWFRRQSHLVEVFADLEPALHCSLFMPRQYYLDQYRKRRISAANLEQAIADVRLAYPAFDLDQTQLKAEADQAATPANLSESIAEVLPTDGYWQRAVADELGKFSASYFDQSQANTQTLHGPSFWRWWHQEQEFDRGMAARGLKDFRASASTVSKISAESAINTMLTDMGLSSSHGQRAYLQRLMASTLGWASQFRYVEWQGNLGHDVDSNCRVVDLLAVRLAYDYALYCEHRDHTEIQELLNSYNRTPAPQTGAHNTDMLEQLVWQTAFELGFLDQVRDKINWHDDQPDQASLQMAFCIDVRSEMIRRHIETAEPSIQTIGFAGFFGVACEYKKASEKQAGYRLPVLFSPGVVVDEVAKDGDPRTKSAQRENQQVLNFFKGMRKGPLSSFLFVELFGIISIENMIRSSWQALVRSYKQMFVPSRFEDRHLGPSTTIKTPSGEILSVAEKASAASNALTHMGLTDSFARLVVITGHGSVTTNNSFGSALDCGACGGHAGDVNARILVAMLNDQDIRDDMAQNHAIHIPASTQFAAAVHETVTDKIYLLDREQIPSSHHGDVQALEGSLATATATTQLERSQVVSNTLDHDSHRRSHNWAETRPEWGLTGNACFVVAPRSRTKGADLASRAFLHDYNWRKDKEFKTLELIMTAPMVVTNWINMQYFASTTAPQIYGAGSKVLHNLTNENGVVEGNGGDLRIGLPYQSVFDGKGPVHEPLRLTVLIEAPREAVERIIGTHDVVKELVDNGWLNLILIDQDGKRLWRRLPQQTYVAY